jgi:hypothetical protein
MGGGTIQERFAIQFVDGCFNQTGSGEDIGGYASLALEPNTNAVNLSYYHFNNADLRYAYKEKNSNVWYTMSIDGSGTRVGKYTSLAVDNSGNCHISYYDSTNDNLKYAYGPAGTGDISWQLYNVDTPGIVGRFTSLAVDNSGNRHISYYDNTKDDLKYAYGPAGTGDISWQLYNIDTPGIVGRFTSLAVDNSGNRHISYYDSTNDNLKYAYGPAGTGDISWQLYKVDTPGNVGENRTAIALDNSGNRHISYYDTTNVDLKYAFGPAGTGDISWQLYNVDTSGNVGFITSIAINPNTQKPSITYLKTNVTGNNEIRIASQRLNSKTSWEIGVLDSSLILFGFNGNSQLAFDANSDTHLSYYDYLGSEGRLRYALDPAGQYGDSCPIFTTTTFDVSMQVVSVSAETIGVDFSLNQTSPSFQLPFDVSSHIVPDCPAE